MENWQNLYLELAEILAAPLTVNEQEITALGGPQSPLRWIDLWHNQVNFLDEEREFPTPATFLSFRTAGVADLGEKVQQLTLQVDAYLFYETFADTFAGAYNQQDAVRFLAILDFIKGRLHATQGATYTAMRHTGFSPVDTGGAGNMYMLNFQCLIHDESAVKYYGDGRFAGLDIGPGQEYQLP